MKIFLCLPNQPPTEEARVVYRYLQSLGAIVYTNDRTLQPTSVSISFDKIDTLFILARTENKEAGYLSALALAQKRPIVYLLPKGNALPEELDYIRQNSDVNKYLIIKFYDDKNWQNRIGEALETIERGDKRWDAPSIKFTWRLTPRIDRYLRWRTSGTQLTKADWLRDYIVKEIIDKDHNYQQFLRHE
ncbi:MAG: hypothetical protein NUV82_00925 [Candidatus Komeilibacteria bacterium]|nr:hypothetical protein [Candidatus Komeilibacteria bacterium]